MAKQMLAIGTAYREATIYTISYDLRGNPYQIWYDEAEEVWKDNEQRILDYGFVARNYGYVIARAILGEPQPCAVPQVEYSTTN